MLGQGVLTVQGPFELNSLSTVRIINLLVVSVLGYSEINLPISTSSFLETHFFVRDKESRKLLEEFIFQC